MNGLILSYEDFVIRFEKKGRRAFPVHASSSRGEARSRFHCPFDVAELQQWRTDFHAAVPCGSPVWKKRGRLFFDALFRGEVLNLYRRALDHVEETPESGIRVKIFLELNHPDLAWLSELPWELLFDPVRRVFLALSRRTPMVRYLSLPKPIPKVAIEPPLRVLLAEYRDARGKDLFLKKERGHIERALAGSRFLFDTLRQASRKSLRVQLSRQDYHVLHFMGHGSFEKANGKGSLWMGSSDERGEKVSGEDFAAMLQDFPSLKLVLLGACDSGRTATRGGTDPFAGVASALVAGGMPAVVAMQYPIYSETAASFSDWFYAGLARGESLEQAVTVGRQALEADYPQHPDWLCPVLFLRAASGMLYRPETPTSASTRHKKKEPWPSCLPGLKANPWDACPRAEIQPRRNLSSLSLRSTLPRRRSRAPRPNWSSPRTTPAPSLPRIGEIAQTGKNWLKT